MHTEIACDRCETPAWFQFWNTDRSLRHGFCHQHLIEAQDEQSAALAS